MLLKRGHDLLLTLLLPGYFRSLWLSGEGLFNTPSNYISYWNETLAKGDIYNKFPFHLFLENYILLFVTYDVIKFGTIKNNNF